jgi:hypothetical protein
MDKTGTEKIMVITLMCIFDPTLSQDFSHSFSKKYESDLIERKETGSKKSAAVKFNLPAIEMVKGNSHIHDIRFSKGLWKLS